LLITLGSSGLFVDTRETTANLAGSFGDVIGEHLKALPLYGLSQLTMQGSTTFAALLLGMVAGWRRLLAGITGNEPPAH
jgi:uncharacterized protein